MSQFCGAHRAPRAGIDPVESAPAALAVIQLAMHLPPTDETIALVLDDDHRGHTIVVVDGTDDPDSVLDVVERLVDSIVASGRDGSLVVASIRPGRGPLDGRRRPLARGQRPRRGRRRRAPRVVRRRRCARSGHGVVPARPARRAAAVAARESARAGPPLGGREAQAGGAEPAHQLAALDLDGAERRRRRGAAPRGCRSGRPGTPAAGCRGRRRSRAARRARCR